MGFRGIQQNSGKSGTCVVEKAKKMPKNPKDNSCTFLRWGESVGGLSIANEANECATSECDHDRRGFHTRRGTKAPT